MILKHADSRDEDIASLTALLAHPEISGKQTQLIEQEIRNIKAGTRGENEVAYELKVRYEATKNVIVLHDLRIEHNGHVAQIDHLIINRILECYVCESKHFAEGVSINDFGEFTAFYQGKPRGVPSPIVQNERHITILERLMMSGTIPMPKRLGMTLKPNFKSFVLVSKHARISRPKKDIRGLDSVIKSDQIVQEIDKDLDHVSPLTLAKFIGTETLETIAQALMQSHKPIQFDWHAKFGIDPVKTSEVSKPRSNKTVESTQEDISVQDGSTPVSVIGIQTAPINESVERKSKYNCAECKNPVAYKVAQFCWFNKPKFGGRVLCVTCQKTV